LFKRPNDLVSAGIDGARAGWFLVCNKDGRLTASLNSDLADVLQALAGVSCLSEKILIDIPLGLSSPRGRTLETSARQILKGQGSSVFSVPVKAAVYAEDYVSACDINQKATGKRISKQVWYICNKIREADRLRDRGSPLSNRLIESHPEICFRRLNGGEMLMKKKLPEGQCQRLQILSQYSDIDVVISEWKALWRRNQVQIDDMLDAAVLAVCSGMPGELIYGQSADEQLWVPAG